MKKEGIKRGIAVTLTFLILIILLLAGPANAVIVSLDVQDTTVEKGSLMHFEAGVEVESGEFLQADYFVLRLIGPETIECKFQVNGTPISGCNGITIQKIASPNLSGYGYGFEPGEFMFNIALDTSYYSLGKYETYLQVVKGTEPLFQERGEDVHIKSPPVPGGLAGCSIRAEGGNLVVETPFEEFGKGKINFHIPLGNANNGKGSLTAQKGRERISYKFDIDDVTDNTQTYATIQVTGELKIDGGPKKQETAEIYYDKIANTISVSNNLDIQDMKITFKKWC